MFERNNNTPRRDPFGRIGLSEEQKSIYDATGRIKQDNFSTPTLPIPQRKPPILNSEFDEEVIGFIKNNERPVNHLYKDNGGNMTIGVGHLVTDIKKAKNLPLYLHDKDKPIHIATDHEIETIYDQINKIPHGQK